MLYKLINKMYQRNINIKTRNKHGHMWDVFIVTILNILKKL